MKNRGWGQNKTLRASSEGQLSFRDIQGNFDGTRTIICLRKPAMT